jgi:hypothetical protein
MKKILSIILITLLLSNGLGFSARSLNNIFSEAYSCADEKSFIILVPEFFVSLIEENNSINEKHILHSNGRIYGYIKYFNGSKVTNSSVLLWEGSSWGFSNMPDYIVNTDNNGYYEFENLSYGRYHIDPVKIGLKISEKNVILNEEKPELKVDFIAVNSKIYQQSSIIIFFILFSILAKL